MDSSRGANRYTPGKSERPGLEQILMEKIYQYGH